MDGSELELRYEQFLARWLERVEGELGLQVAEGPPADWVRDVYRDHGELPADRFARIAFERKLRAVLDAFPAVAASAELDTGLRVAIRPDATRPSTDFPAGMVMLAELVVQSFDPAGVRAEVADAVQTYLADRYGRLWPLCPEHERGLHAVTHEGEALWWCRAENHPGGRIPFG
ncbi:hypothetical protein J7E97_23865 [Streptomyces sp. ISL-66]|uniref:hypothetical protein n=1 Tax=Streptomyces sp. ISL-66 TaxID=2819186 RepID=UPI001BEC3DFF|nr:hypothetical protein [Streptomyces sp. ISL-66]MBT2470819.1 hypothetical protein [Streptomyces sp. ISL-66]